MWGQSSVYGEPGGGEGQDWTSQLFNGCITDGSHSHTVSRRVVAHLCVNGVDGPDAETGIFSPVFMGVKEL